jgi:endonuclease-3
VISGIHYTVTDVARRPKYYGTLDDASLAAIYNALATSINPKSDLEYGSSFELLIAVVLSAQATDKSVNLATRKLYPIANTPPTVLALGIEGLTPYIKHIGLYRGKAKNVIELCRLLIERHGGEVPGDRAALEALPGVGRKTASVVLNVAFGQPTIAVDTHVQRVANRLGIAKTTTPEQTEQVLLARTPTKYLQHAHHYLILHGRYRCTARTPQCRDCPVRPWCPFPDKTD